MDAIRPNVTGPAFESRRSPVFFLDGGLTRRGEVCVVCWGFVSFLRGGGGRGGRWWGQGRRGAAEWSGDAVDGGAEAAAGSLPFFAQRRYFLDGETGASAHQERRERRTTAQPK